MGGDAVAETAHDRHPVSQRSQAGEVAAEGYSGQARLDLAEHGAVLGRRGHLGIKGLYVRRSPLQVQDDDRLVLDQRSAGGRASLGSQQAGERKPAESQGPHLQQFPAGYAFAGVALAVAVEGEHGFLVSSNRVACRRDVVATQSAELTRGRRPHESINIR